MARKFFSVGCLLLLGLIGGAQEGAACSTIAPEAMKKGVNFVLQKKPREAIKEFNIGLADGYHNRGEAYQMAGRWAEAMADFHKATELNPNDTRPYYWRAKYDAQQGQLADAMEELNRAIAIKGTFCRGCYQMRAWIHSVRGELNLALKDYHALLLNAPGNYGYLTKRGFVFLRKGDLDRALADFNKVIKVYPETTMAYFGRSLVYRAKGESALAEADLGKVRKADDGLAEYYLKNSKELQRHGLTKMAERDRAYAVMIKPSLENRQVME